MTRIEIKKILISLKTLQNENIVNNILGKIDLLTDEKIDSMVAQIGNSEEDIRSYLQKKLEERLERNSEEHTPINEMFTYGTAGKTIHLHMPIDLHQMMSEKGISKTIDTVNLQLLDAIEKIRRLQNEGYYKFKGKDNIYMISPIILRSELKFLNELNFNTKIYKKKELQDDRFVREHQEAQLAIRIFGKEKNVGTAIIGLDVVNSYEWQEKRKAKVKEFEEKGIKLDTEGKDIIE